MHRSLQVPEVLSLIIDSVGHNVDNNELQKDPKDPCSPYDSPSLLALVLTSQKFSGPALDLLWETQFSLVPLFRCFPSDMYEYNEDEPEHPITFLRPPKPMDWDRVQFYSSRIKSVGTFKSASTSCNLTLENFAFISLHRPVLLILPRLRKLGCEDEEMFTHIRLFLSPILTDIVVEWSDSMGDVLELFHLLGSLKDLAPNLRSFRLLHIDDELGLTLDELPENSFALPRLRTLQCSPIYLTGNSIDELASLPCLHTLHIAINFDPATVVLRNLEQAYSSLSDIEITSQDLEYCISFLHLVTSCSLREVYISLENNPRAIQLRRFFHEISQHPSNDSIAWVDIDTILGCPDHPETTEYAITSFDLQPLLFTSKLIMLSISLDSQLELDDNLLRDMASAWPKLCILQLVSKSRKPLVRVPKTTLRCLVPFANNCPFLRTLALVLDARDVSQLDLPPRHHNLRSINLGRSPIEDTGAVAAFLSGVFPLIEIKSEGRHSVKWDKVTALVKRFTAVRHQERVKAVEAIEGDEESSLQFVEWVHTTKTSP